MADFDPENEWFSPGSYTASVAWGDPQAEGTDKPCFAGAQEFTIIPRRTVDVLSLIHICGKLQGAIDQIAEALANAFNGIVPPGFDPSAVQS